MKNVIKWTLSLALVIGSLIMIGLAGYGISKLYHSIPGSITNVFEVVFDVVFFYLYLYYNH